MNRLRHRDRRMGARCGVVRFAGRPVSAVLWTAGVLVAGGLLLSAGCKRGEGQPAGSDAQPAPGASVAPGTPGTPPAASDSRARSGQGGATSARADDQGRPADGSQRESRRRGTGGEAPLPPPAIATVRPAEEMSAEELRQEVLLLRSEHEKLSAASARLTPQEPYILINTTLNRMSMKVGDEFIVQDAVVSTGSNTELVEPGGKRRWFFSTPKGVHTVKRKMVAPVWVKPDWAFVEENEPIPGAQAEERFEEGTLGKYGLYFGNGYLIHGTLFQRFLGQSVTHGCVRVGDADLDIVYQNAKVGTRIYIY